MIYTCVAGTGCEQPPPLPAFEGLFAARGMAASAATHPQHTAHWVPFPWEDGEERQHKLSREGVLQDPAARKTLAWEILLWCTSFLAHITFTYCRSKENKAEINMKSCYLLWFDFDLAALRKLFHSYFASFNGRTDTVGSALVMNLPLAAQSPGARHETKTKSCRQTKQNEVKKVPWF